MFYLGELPVAVRFDWKLSSHDKIKLWELILSLPWIERHLNGGPHPIYPDYPIPGFSVSLGRLNYDDMKEKFAKDDYPKDGGVYVMSGPFEI